jgi:hypothetical protein
VRKVFVLFIIFIIFTAFSCAKKEKDREPGLVLQRWIKSIENLDYYNYSKCEAYPKSQGVFLEIYKDDYYMDLMVNEVGDPDDKNIRKDYKGNSYVSRKVTFEAAVVKRGRVEPYQTVNGDVEFYKFLDGDKSKNGWLISNRTITRINK